ncbi:response regulator [Phormidium sp. CLA17]|uniref:hybrid sensor histidine kinase/response regulator n=1 Tax=Leptolyngbya sp. Cla-17 TaxID=2803751 RepID=UPI00149139F4|nr:ATP-binding protein [Leptolyngbya sp. Cla-17]MBM0742814.1 response regulator [Leptolyngbya sp. Cla-17]
MASTKILVVEDEVIVAKTITSQLNQLGYIVTGTASSGEMAIAKVIETQPDLILMDIVLKGSMDGITTAGQIREQVDIPIIYLTAYADDSTLQRAKATQPFGYIVKPFTADDLRVAVEVGLFKHQVARELQDNRDQLATLLHSMSDAVIATDAEGVITFMNPAAEMLTEWQQDEALGQSVTNVFQLINEVTETPAENPISKVLKSQQVAYLDHFTALVTKTGSLIPIGDSASPLKRLSGEILGAVVVFWNISDRRQTELLSQALEKEKELNRLKSQFVSTVSHEFRNPLAIVRTATELLEVRQNLTETQKHAYLQRIKISVRSMNQLMEDVLFMGQAEADRLVYQPAPLHLEQFCQDLAEEFLMFDGRSHNIVFNSQGDSQNAWIDERLLRYILTNLLSNAIKYSPPGTTVQLTLRIDASNRIATLSVQDQGIGISEADQPRLFESFFRAANVTSIQGTGLGLAIVKRCVEAHSGQINLTSQVGVGTTVSVTLPLDLDP